MCERCGAEVTKRDLTQWYFQITEYAQRAAGRHGRRWRPTWPDRVLTAAAQLDRPLRGRARRLRGRGPRRAGDGLHDPAGHAVRRDLLGGRGRRRAGRRAGHGRRSGRRSTRTWSEVRKATEIERLADRPAPRPACSWACTRSTRSTASGSRSTPPTTCWPTTAPARSWRCPAQDQRDWDFATKFDLPIVRTVAAAATDFEGEAYVGDGPAINSANDEYRWTGWTSTRRSRAIIAWLEEQGAGPRHGQLPAARLAAVAGSATGARRSRSSTARPAARSPVPEDQLPVVLPELQRRRPEAQGRLAAGGRRGLGQRRLPAVRRPGQARHRHDGHLRRLVVVLPALLLAARRHAGRSTPTLVDAWMPVRPVRRRRRARDAAPAVRPLLHQGAARHGPGRLRASRSRRC